MATRGQVQDLSGRRFGKLVALRFVARRTHQTMWLFRCDCGTEKEIAAGVVKAGSTVSCGCHIREVTRLRSTSHGHKSGGAESPEYKSWRSMLDRCEKPSHKSFSGYGGRGVSVCSEWHEFAAFLRDMGLRPAAGYSLDRINANGNYAPDNCRWATARTQAANRRSSRLVNIDGELVCIAEAGRRLGLGRSKVNARIHRGWTPEQALELASRFDR
jgi:hypothetical protein